MDDCITNPQLNGDTGVQVGGDVREGEGIGVIDLAYLRDLLGILSDLEVAEFETPRFRVRFARDAEHDGETLRNVGFSVPDSDTDFEQDPAIDMARTRRQLQESTRNIWQNPALWAETKQFKLDGTIAK